MNDRVVNYAVSYSSGEGGDQGFVDSEGGGLANEYIALIPLSDWRLRPRRTALKITVAVLLCLLISALLLFFLLLRSIHVFSNSPLITPPGVLIDQDSAIVSINITVSHRSSTV